MEPWGTPAVTWDLEDKEPFVKYDLANNYGTKTKEEEEGQAKINSQIEACEGQSQML